MAGIETKTVDADEAGMRLDRWFKLHYPGLAFGQLQKLLRSGRIRLEGKRAKSDTRIAAGQAVRLPPQVTSMEKPPIDGPLTRNTIRDRNDSDVLKSMMLYEDKKVFVFNKPAGLAVQGGSGVNRHIDSMLESMRSQKGEKPRLVHRLDRETSGVLVVAPYPWSSFRTDQGIQTQRHRQNLLGHMQRRAQEARRQDFNLSPQRALARGR